MYPQQINGYLRELFKENKCQILKDHDHYLHVQLTIDMDKKIMNRPFYWKYVESTNDEPRPAQVTFITDKNRLVDDIKGEVIHFGSPRLTQLFQVMNELGSIVQMYEKGWDKPEQMILTPWLGVNYKIAYRSDQTKEMLLSLGINLMTGEVVEDFQESLNKKDLDYTVPENTYKLPYIVKPIRALERLDGVIEDRIGQDDHTWAEEAKLRWEKDRAVLEHFYEGLANKPDCYEIEKEAMDQQYEARIKIDILNGGLFYLK